MKGSLQDQPKPHSEREYRNLHDQVPFPSQHQTHDIESQQADLRNNVFQSLQTFPNSKKHTCNEEGNPDHQDELGETCKKKEDDIKNNGTPKVRAKAVTKRNKRSDLGKRALQLAKALIGVTPKQYIIMAGMLDLAFLNTKLIFIDSKS